MVENAADLIIQRDGRGRRIYVSPASRAMLGFEPAELVAGHAHDLIHPDDLADVTAAFAAVGPGRPEARIVMRMRRKDGRYIWIEGRYRHLAHDGSTLAVLRDVTAQKTAELALAEANARLEVANNALLDLANRDGLTGLDNRRRFDTLLDEEFRRARRQELPLGLVLADVDCFKPFNDRYGHLAGDDCLRRVAEAIYATLRRPGEHAARYGGEEIAALLPATDADGAGVVAERIRLAVRTLGIPHAGSPFGVVTISAGAAAMIPFEDDRAASLVAAADRALYDAKADGRDRVRVGHRVETMGVVTM